MKRTKKVARVRVPRAIRDREKLLAALDTFISDQSGQAITQYGAAMVVSAVQLKALLMMQGQGQDHAD